MSTSPSVAIRASARSSSASRTVTGVSGATPSGARISSGQSRPCIVMTSSTTRSTPAWVATTPVPRTEDPRARQVMVQDLPSLVWASNLVVEFHTPQWTAAAPAVADRLVLDLDPGAAAVVDCCRVALHLRERLAADGLESFAKTSGSKGLHLLVPVVPTPSERVSAYAKRLAVEAGAELPRLVTHRMTRALRAGKVFVDHSQNAAAKTTATPYTLRARERPAVSAPVTWEEVEACAAPADLAFLMGDIAPRLERYGELLGPLFDAGRAGDVP
ncbi:non-homologous end-joining DNA ligase LigD [Streptomyces hydrogenans]|uniref:non-homologous end-joining DNA ligase LigD n=1 Tax=Streptomyces hydrogenans TaxID=1873719 RepID=UPI003830F5EF